MRSISIVIFMVALCGACGDDDGDTDGGPGTDGGRADAGSVDGGGGDGGGDAGPGACATCASPGICCGDECATPVPAGTNGRGEASFRHCGACGVECDQLRASSCSVLLMPPMPECVCGAGQACPKGQECMPAGDGYECR